MLVKITHYCQRILILRRKTASSFEVYHCTPTLPPNGKKFSDIIFQVGKGFFKKYTQNFVVISSYENITINLGTLIRHTGKTR